ncbi:hypothetical protein PFICI_11372 [Pestalotiopsis fici W106-1]|uniref:Uncharacterized protein n=1 Tax=Pestalotiopsis fici (strain W106-1 / CGMCC3.15140) TaxID=1229662 RepID=W3WUD8_PESFW|nr:uncharacterized protein PFICI_11372 [Pestalotiopsis fici W106-1]ETS77498.1 hypothetical protein PFICI_11372 [Pestalotiopsis fici W106-1]
MTTTTAGVVPRPSADGGRPTSRFQEGSMNDRCSAAPPVQFLGPEEAAEYEKQFYGQAENKNHVAQPPQRAPRRVRSISRRRERPMSAQAQLQTLPYDTLRLRQGQLEQLEQSQDLKMEDVQKKPGLLGRVREVLFGKPTGTKSVLSNVQNEMDKRTSLQQPPTSYTQQQHQPMLLTGAMPAPARPIPIPVQRGGMAKSQSSSQIPQLPASFHGSGGPNMSDRPTKEEIMASYNELMATGFFKAHAIQSTRQPAPGSVPNHVSRGLPPLSTIPSLDRPSLEQASKRSSFTMPPSPGIREFAIPPMPSSLPPPPPLFPETNQVKVKPSWESFRKGFRGRKRARGDSWDDNVSEVASMVSQQLPSSSTAEHIATQVGGISRRVSKKLRKMPSALASQLQTKSDGMIRIVPTVADGPETDSEEKNVYFSPGAPGMETGLRVRSVSKRLQKRNENGKGPSRPPVTLDKYLGSTAIRHSEDHQYGTTNWEPMDVDSGTHSRSSVDSLQPDHHFESAYHTSSDGQSVLTAEPLCIVPDLNKGIPSVPSIPKLYKHERMSVDENEIIPITYGQAL